MEQLAAVFDEPRQTVAVIASGPVAWESRALPKTAWRGVSASSPRQALNAVVFLPREFYGKELGDFSDYRRAKSRTHVPSWLTRSTDEVERLIRRSMFVRRGSGRPRKRFGPGSGTSELSALNWMFLYRRPPLWATGDPAKSIEEFAEAQAGGLHPRTRSRQSLR